MSAAATTLLAMAEPVVHPIKDGVFFTAPPSLPRGRHALERSEILGAQRERIMIAMTELMAAQGFDAVTVGDVASRAALSRAAFYACFADKESCAFAAYKRFIGVLLGKVAAALADDGPFEAVLFHVISSYLATLESDPVVGRAFQVEMDAVGPRARQWRRESLAKFADALAERHALLAQDRPGTPTLPHSAYLGMVYAVRQLASDALDTEPEPALGELAAGLTAWLLPVYLGPKG